MGGPAQLRARPPPRLWSRPGRTGVHLVRGAGGLWNPDLAGDFGAARGATRRAAAAGGDRRGRSGALRPIALCLIIERLASRRSEEHTSELQSLMRISYAVFCLKKKKTLTYYLHTTI